MSRMLLRRHVFILKFLFVWLIQFTTCNVHHSLMLLTCVTYQAPSALSFLPLTQKVPP